MLESTEYRFCMKLFIYLTVHENIEYMCMNVDKAYEIDI